MKEDEFEKSVSYEELLLAAYDATSRIFSQDALVRAYYNTDSDVMALRDDDDPIRQHGPKDR